MPIQGNNQARVGDAVASYDPTTGTLHVEHPALAPSSLLVRIPDRLALADIIAAAAQAFDHPSTSPEANARVDQLADGFVSLLREQFDRVGAQLTELRAAVEALKPST